MESFDSLLEGPALTAAKILYKMPTTIQKEVIPAAISKQNVVAISKTCSGKTTSFLFALIQLLDKHSKVTGVRGLILSPTPELSMKTGSLLKKYIDKGESTLEFAVFTDFDQFDSLTFNPDIIITTPQLLLSINMETNFSLSRIKYVVIDEVDQMFKQNISDELTTIFPLLPRDNQILLSSSTNTKLLTEFTQKHINNPIIIEIGPSKLPDHLLTEFYLVSSSLKIPLIVATVQRFQKSLVIVDNIKIGTFLSALFNKLGINSDFIYGFINKDMQSSFLDSFAKQDKIVLFITKNTEKILDIKDVDLVLNYNFPDKSILFLHRSEKTKKGGNYTSFVTKEELPYYSKAQDELNGNEWLLVEFDSTTINDEITKVDNILKEDLYLRIKKEAAEKSEKTFAESKELSNPSEISLTKKANISTKVDTKLPKYGNPLSDTAFKIMLGDNDFKVVKSIIRAFVPDFENVDFEVIPGETQVKLPGKAKEKLSGKKSHRHVSKRTGAMDFRVSSSVGEFVFEMQAIRKKRFDERALYYAAYTYVKQKLRDEESASEDPDQSEAVWYVNLKPVYAIQFLGYETNKLGNLVPEKYKKDRELIMEIKKHQLADNQSYKHYVMHDRITGQEIVRGIHLIQIELPRTKSQNLETGYDFWCYLMKHPNEIQEIIKRTNDPDLKEALSLAAKRLEIVEWSEEDIEKYKSEITTYKSDEAMNDAVRIEGQMEGLKKGKMEGLKEGKMEGLKEGKMEGLKEGKMEGLKEGIEKKDVLKILVGHIKGKKTTDKITKKELKEVNDDRLNEIAKRLIPDLSLNDFSDNDEIEKSEKEIREKRLTEMKREDYNLLEEVIKPMLKE